MNTPLSDETNASGREVHDHLYRRTRDVQQGSAVPRRPEGCIAPASYGQTRLWFLDQLGLGGTAYNVLIAHRLEGDLDERALELGLAQIVHRHESLRTHFAAANGSPQQIVRSTGCFELERTDLRNVIDGSSFEGRLHQRLRREQLHQFDLSRGPLFRAVLARLRAREYALLLTIHHIVTDGWSTGILLRELGTLYAAYLHGKPSPLAELPIQYADYSLWQKQRLQGETLESALHYWRDRLTGAPPQLALPIDRPRADVSGAAGAAVNFTLPAALCTQLKALAWSEAATLFMLLLAAYQALLSRYSGQQDVVVGSPIAGRNHSQTRGLIGFFVNTLIFRTDLSGNPSFREVLRRVKETALGAHRYQYLPFEKLVMDLRPERNLTRQPVFQVALAFHNYPEETLELADMRCAKIAYENLTAKFDLLLHFSNAPVTGCDARGALCGVFEYATELFDRVTIERMAEHLRLFLEKVAADPECSID